MKSITLQIKNCIKSHLQNGSKKIRLTQPGEKVKELEQSNKDKDKLIRYQEASKYVGHFEKTKYTDNWYERAQSKAKESILKIVVIEKK